MTEPVERPRRELGPWASRFVRFINAVTWTWWIASTLMLLISLWAHHHYGVLAFLAICCAGYYAAARIGSRDTMLWRFAAVTLLVAVGVVWIEMR